MNKLCLNCGDKTSHKDVAIDTVPQPWYCVKPWCQVIKSVVDEKAKATADPSVENS